MYHFDAEALEVARERSKLVKLLLNCDQIEAALPIAQQALTVLLRLGYTQEDTEDIADLRHLFQ